MLQILGKVIHQRTASHYDIFHCTKNAVGIPLPGKLLVNQFANVTHQKRITVRISVNFLAYRLNIHACMRVILIITKHLGNLFGMESHIHIEIGGNIPRGVVLFLRVRTDFQLEILHVIYTCQNHAVKSEVQPLFVPLQVLVAKHTQEVEKQLVVAALVHLVNGQHHRLWAHSGKTGDHFR